MSKRLAKIGWTHQGEWQPKRQYRYMDTVNHDRSLYFAREDHESGEEFDESRWGFVADNRGAKEAIEQAMENALRAEEASGLAETQAGHAAEAARRANEEAEKAAEVTEVFSGHIQLSGNSDYLYSIVDAEGNILWGLRRDGSAYQPRGVPEEVKALLKEKMGLEVMEDERYLFVITDSEGNVVFGIRRSDGGIEPEGLSSGGGNGGAAISGECKLQKDENGEFLFTVTDADGYILFGLRTDGRAYLPKGISEEQRGINRDTDKRLSRLEEELKNFSGGTGDWSGTGSMRIPMPRIGRVNLKTSKMPTAKSGLGTKGVNCDLPCEIEFWDLQGNYARMWCLLSAQGNTSLRFPKKNLAVDLFNDKGMDDSFVMRIGDWVAQDSFHLKAYYTDAFRGIGVCSYMLYDEIMRTRGIEDDAPYKRLFMGQYGTTGSDATPDMSENLDTGAKCHPEGFPVEVYQNGEFYGLYSWQLKKHRDNYHMTKKTAEHVHLDGGITSDSLWGGNINWGSFEVRNPKSILDTEGNEYDGDRPKELLGSDSPIYDKSDKDMKRSATVKGYIEALSRRVGELKAKETDLSGDQAQQKAAIREMLERWFEVDFCIDYIIHAQVTNNSDGFNKNWQWTTWDGEKWSPNPYDLDMSWGGYWIGNITTEPPSGWVGNTTSTPIGWIIKYFGDEIKSRYKELRDKGLFNPEHMAGLLQRWVLRIGEDLYEREYDRWPESPCNRNSQVNHKYWERNSTYKTYGSWNSGSTYAKGSTCKEADAVWKSLVADNTGNRPSEDNGERWERISYDSERSYKTGETCWQGTQEYYEFKCMKDCQGESPLLKLYDSYPPELGYYDSPYRVLAWMRERMKALDSLMGYEMTGSTGSLDYSYNADNGSLTLK